MRARDLIQRSPVTIATDADLVQAAEAFSTEGIGSLVVVDSDGRPVGMLTDRDLATRVIGSGLDPLALHVQEVMSGSLVAADADEDVEAVIRTMQHNGIRRVPVLDGGELVGLVSFDDILQVLARQLDDLASGTRTKLRKARLGQGTIRGCVDQKLREARACLEETLWYGREDLMREIDEIRDRLTDAEAGDA